MNFMLQNYLEAVGYEGFYGNNQWFLYEKSIFIIYWFVAF